MLRRLLSSCLEPTAALEAAGRELLPPPSPPTAAPALQPEQHPLLPPHMPSPPAPELPPPSPSKLPLAAGSLSPAAIQAPWSLADVLAVLGSEEPASPAAAPAVAAGARPAAAASAAVTAALSTTEQAMRAFAAGQHRRRHVTPAQARRERQRKAQETADHLQTVEALQRGLSRSRRAPRGGQAGAGEPQQQRLGGQQEEGQQRRQQQAPAVAPAPGFTLAPVFQTSAGAEDYVAQLQPPHSRRQTHQGCPDPAQPASSAADSAPSSARPAAAAAPAATSHAPLSSAGSTGGSSGTAPRATHMSTGRAAVGEAGSSRGSFVAHRGSGSSSGAPAWGGACAGASSCSVEVHPAASSWLCSSSAGCSLTVDPQEAGAEVEAADLESSSWATAWETPVGAAQRPPAVQRQARSPADCEELPGGATPSFETLIRGVHQTRRGGSCSCANGDSEMSTAASLMPAQRGTAASNGAAAAAVPAAAGVSSALEGGEDEDEFHSPPTSDSTSALLGPAQQRQAEAAGTPEQAAAAGPLIPAVHCAGGGNAHATSSSGSRRTSLRLRLSQLPQALHSRLHGHQQHQERRGAVELTAEDVRPKVPKALGPAAPVMLRRGRLAAGDHSADENSPML